MAAHPSLNHLNRLFLAFILLQWGCLAWSATQKMEKLAPIGRETMQFTLATICEDSRGCHLGVSAQGWITTESVKNFTERASTIASGATFVINSDGGDLQSAMELGKAIRAKQLNARVGTLKPNENKTNPGFTIVPARCLSACLLTYLGGVNRTIEPTDIIGFHGLTVANASAEVGKPTGESHAKEILGALGRYIESMGVDRRTTDFMLLAKGDAFQRIPLATAKQLSIDNQSNNALSAWRLQATDNGSLLALVTEKQTKSGAIAALAITRPPSGSPNENLRCIVFVKPAQRSISNNDIKRYFPESVNVELRSRGKPISGKILSPWQLNGEGAQTILLISTAELQNLTQSLSFELDINFPENSGLSIDRSTPFGTQGLKGVLVTLTK